MPLFADTAAENAGWIATGVTALTGITSNLFQWLTARDKARLDAAPLQREILELKTELDTERKTCQEQLGKLAGRLETVEAKLETERELRHELNNKLTRVTTELAALRPPQ